MLKDPDLGTIEFVPSQRAKNINVRILSTGLKVSLPFSSTQEQAMKFIDSIRQKLIKKQGEVAKGVEKSAIFIDENTRLQTLTFVVEAKATERANIYFALKSNVLSIEFPHSTNCASKETQKHFWNGISYFLRKEASRLLPNRTQQLADLHGFTFSGIKIQSSKSRWGSCSSSRTINLSLYLMLLPAHLIDYVLLHELCHTKEMNHGDNFWRWMDKVTDNKSKALRAELKGFHMPS
jgi:predicted metal-dependent hydrolase